MGTEMKSRAIALWPGKKVNAERGGETEGRIEGLESVEVGPAARRVLRQEREMGELERRFDRVGEMNEIREDAMSAVGGRLEFVNEKDSVGVDDRMRGSDKWTEGEERDKGNPFRDSREILADTDTCMN